MRRGIPWGRWSPLFWRWYRGEGWPVEALPDIFPAHPGTNVLDLVVEPAEVDGERDRVTVYASPVLAWLFCVEGSLPITARGLGDGRPDDRDLPIEFPAGQIVSTGAGAWPDRRAWLEGMTGSNGHA